MSFSKNSHPRNRIFHWIHLYLLHDFEIIFHQIHIFESIFIRIHISRNRIFYAEFTLSKPNLSFLFAIHNLHFQIRNSHFQIRNSQFTFSNSHISLCSQVQKLNFSLILHPQNCIFHKIHKVRIIHFFLNSQFQNHICPLNSLF